MKKHLLSFILMAMGAGMANAAEPVKGILCSYFGHEAFFPLSESPSVKYVDKSGEQNAVVLVGGAEKMAVALIDGGKLAVSYDNRALSEYTVNAKVTANGQSKTFDNQVVKAAEGKDGDVIVTLPAAAVAGYEMAEQTVKVKVDADGNISMVDGQTIDFTGTQDVVVTVTSVAGTLADGKLNVTVEGEGSNGIDVTVVYSTDTPTGITSTTVAGTQMADGKYLDNNKVVIVKNGKKFTVQGTEIK